MQEGFKVQIVSDPAVSHSFLVSGLGRAIAEYGRTHCDMFETDEYREWQKRYRERMKRKGVVSCHSGSTFVDI